MPLPLIQLIQLIQQHEAVLLALAAAVVLGGWVLRYRPGRGAHRWRLRSAKRCLRKLERMPGDGQVIAYLRQVDPWVFEEVVLLGFRRAGARTRRNPRYTGDGGIDGRFRYAGQSYCVQAKRYKGAIKADQVRVFRHAIDREARWRHGRLRRRLMRSNIRGVFVHTGTTGPRARQVAIDHRIEIISGERLAALLRGEWGPD